MSEPLGHIGERSVPRWAAAGALAAAVLVAAGCTADNTPSPRAAHTVAEQSADGLQVLPEFDSSHEQQLLKGTWNYMIGAKQTPAGLEIHRTGEAILTNPNAGHTPLKPDYIANPPVNTYGTRLSISHGSDVGISAHLTDIHGLAALSFRSKPPIRYDERLERQPGIDVSVDGSHATVTSYGEAGAKTGESEIDLGKASADADITVAQEGSEVIAVVDGHRTTLQAKPLASGEVWFGMDAGGLTGSGASFKVTGLDAFSVHGSRVDQVDMSRFYDNVHASPDGLASIAKSHGHGDKLMGTAVDLPALMADPQYTEFVLQNFNEIETEILAKFQAVEPIEGQYEFAELDALVDFANKHGLALHGHALVFGEAYPKWLHDKLAVASPDQARSLMKGYITTVVSRYDGKHGHGEIKYWDVVNEPFDSDDWGQLDQQNIWYKALGKDYIFDALKFAKQANPHALAGINEWGLETDDDRWNAMVQLVQEAKDRGVPLDYVGFQAHFDEDTLNDQDAMDAVLNKGILAQHASQLAGMGVLFRISEASVAENGNPDMQAQVYAVLLRTCQEASNCIGFNMWGAASVPFYFTTERDTDGTLLIGDDAPVYQDPRTGKIVLRPAFPALIREAGR